MMEPLTLPFRLPATGSEIDECTASRCNGRTSPEQRIRLSNYGNKHVDRFRRHRTVDSASLVISADRHSAPFLAGLQVTSAQCSLLTESWIARRNNTQWIAA